MSSCPAPVPLSEVITQRARKSAEIAKYPKAKLPAALQDFSRVCANMILATFPERSQHAVCVSAARATGASPDTFERILSGATKHPDARLIFTVLAIHQTRTGNAMPLGGGFEISITQTGGAESCLLRLDD
jgi:hypothetical protein